MKRILIVLAALLVAGTAGLHLYLGSDALQARVETELEAAINRDVSVGAIDITLLHAFPDLAVELTDVRVQDAEQPDDVIVLPRAWVNVGLAPLLSRVLVCRVELEDALLKVRAEADGSSNLDDLVSEAWLAEPATFEAVVLEGITVADAEVAYQNTAGRVLGLTGLTADLTAALTPDSTAFDGEIRTAGLRLGPVERGRQEAIASILALTLSKGPALESLELGRARLSVGRHALDLTGLPIDWNTVPRLVDLAVRMQQLAGGPDLERERAALEAEARSWIDAEKKRRRRQLEDAVRRGLDRLLGRK